MVVSSAPGVVAYIPWRSLIKVVISFLFSCTVRCISTIYDDVLLRAVVFFVMFVSGRSYGQATLMDCSLPFRLWLAAKGWGRRIHLLQATCMLRGREVGGIGW